MKTPHKHAEIIKAWADGSVIEFYSKGGDGWTRSNNPQWYDDYEYRIKPEPKPDHVYYGVFEMNGSVILESWFTKQKDGTDELKLIFDGETGKLKSAEIL